MDSRNILSHNQKIRVHLDLATFNQELNAGSREAKVILGLQYRDMADNNDNIQLVRSPGESPHENLASVVNYQLVRRDSQIDCIKIVTEDVRESMAFDYKMRDIESIAATVFGSKKLSEDDIQAVISVFIQAVFNRFEKQNIFITNHPVLIDKRLWFESHFPGGPLNILSVGEAFIFLDLFYKKRGIYLQSPGIRLNRGYWYWLSMRLKIPHFNVGSDMVNALGYRITYALMALDEIGKQFFSGVNNDTMDDILYHFNYVISLVTGIFDNLALETDRRLGINFGNQTRISLSNNSGRDFLREVRRLRPQLRAHINSHVDFINLIYLFREKVIHREGISKTRYEYEGEDGRWHAHFLRVSDEKVECMRRCGNTAVEGSLFSNWGLYEEHGEAYLEPFHFAMKTLEYLVEFVDAYLQLLGMPNFVNGSNQRTDRFAETMNRFNEGHLGF